MNPITTSPGFVVTFTLLMPLTHMLFISLLLSLPLQIDLVSVVS
jgi:hypothetical protein